MLKSMFRRARGSTQPALASKSLQNYKSAALLLALHRAPHLDSGENANRFRKRAKNPRGESRDRFPRANPRE